MTKLVLRLNRGAKIGLVLALLGVALGLYGQLEPALWAKRASILPLVVGTAMYYGSRYRDFKRRPRSPTKRDD